MVKAELKCDVVFHTVCTAWSKAGPNSHFPSSPTRSRSSSCKPCTVHWIRAKLASLRVQRELWVNLCKSTERQISTDWLVVPMWCVWLLNPGQVSESDLWSAELADRLRGEEETGGGCSVGGRRSSPGHVCYIGLRHQFRCRARLDHRLCSEKGWARFGVKIEGKNGFLGNPSIHAYIHQFRIMYLKIMGCVCARRKKSKERRGRND